MNQKELITAISKRFFLSKNESQEIIKFIIEVIMKDLKNGERFYLRDFGSFTKKKQASKKVRHPKTGRIITIPERITVVFNSSKYLLKYIK